MALTIKQQKFADEFLISGNATDAAKKAGYSPRTAGRIGGENLKKLEIKKYIDRRRKKMADAKIADQQEVLEYLSQVLRGAMTETVVTAKGEVVGGVPPKITDRNRAAELLGRRFGTFNDRQKKKLTKAQIDKLKADTKVAEGANAQLSDLFDRLEDTIDGAE